MNYETIHEMDYDGDVGSLIGFILEGHGHTLEEVEAFVQTAIEEEYGPRERSGSWMVSEVWWRTVPFYDDEGQKTDSWTYVYDADGSKGGKVGTRVEHDQPWSRECFRHPGIVAYTGFPERQIIDSEGIAVDGYVYACRECAEVIQTRLDEAYKAAREEAAREARNAG